MPVEYSTMTTPRVRLGVSACLLGERVRYDGGHRRDAYLTEVLGPSVEWVAVCPEVELGLGVPRATLSLVGEPPRLVQDGTGEDLTERMRAYAEARAGEIARLELDGYVFKSGSPSCGVFDARGLFAAALVARLPALPVEDERRLADPAIRERFLGRVRARAAASGRVAP
jgi:uncharacterized protein YbbK (DUF523 family)